MKQGVREENTLKGIVKIQGRDSDHLSHQYLVQEGARMIFLIIKANFIS